MADAPRKGATIEELPSDDEEEAPSALPNVIDGSESDAEEDDAENSQASSDQPDTGSRAPKAKEIIDGPSKRKKEEYAEEELAQVRPTPSRFLAV